MNKMIECKIESSVSRLMFVDQLKGFAIVLVVIGHIYNFSLLPAFSHVPTFISMIHMPIFMFIAGYMFHKKGNTLNIVSYFHSMSKKFRRICVPFISFTVIACILRNWNYCDLLMNEMKYGYWFLFTLFLFYLFYYPFLYFSKLPKFIELLVYTVFSILLILFCKYVLLGGSFVIKLVCSVFFPFFIRDVVKKI